MLPEFSEGRWFESNPRYKEAVEGAFKRGGAPLPISFPLSFEGEGD
jgi:hypothetical protein